MNINRVTIAGRLTRDPEVKNTPDLAIAEFSLAINHFGKDAQGTPKESVDFIEVTAYGRTAETISKHLKKGREVYVEGHLKLEKWEKDGQARSKLKVIAESMQFVGPKQQSESLTSSPARTKPAPDFSKPPQQYNPDEEPDSIPY